MLYISWLYISQKWYPGLSQRQTFTVQTPLAHVSLPCSAGADCVWVLERADKMLSGVISTFERMFARGLWEAAVAGAGVFRPLVRLLGLVGVPGEGLDAGLTPGGRKINSRIRNSKWPLNARHFPVTELSEMSHRNSSVHDPLVVHCIYKEKIWKLRLAPVYLEHH